MSAMIESWNYNMEINAEKVAPLLGKKGEKKKLKGHVLFALITLWVVS